jgi:uncharacterized RDD family membrane protein YckC
MGSAQKYCTACGLAVMQTFLLCPGCGCREFTGTPQTNKLNPKASLYPQQGPSTYQQLPISGAGDTAVYAGFWRRVAAFLIDLLIASVAAYSIAFAIGFSLGVQYPSWAASKNSESTLYGLGILVVIITFWLYNSISEASSAQATLGKRAIGIQVTDLANQRISFGRATSRFFFKLLLSCLPLISLINFVMAAFTKQKRAGHDFGASTLVICDPARGVP